MLINRNFKFNLILYLLRIVLYKIFLETQTEKQVTTTLLKTSDKNILLDKILLMGMIN